MSGRVVFWYGCNVLRHGDIIQAAIAVLRAIGLEVAPAGGPGYCCGTSKDGNLRAAEGMARRTVGKFNALSESIGGGPLVTWCPSCHRHMDQFMGGYTDPAFAMSHFAQIVHARRDRLRERLTRPVERRVVLHRHSGFREVDVNPLVEDLLDLIPGLERVPGGPAVPGHMCSALAGLPPVMKDVTAGVCTLARGAGATDVVTVFHSCQRMLCGLEQEEPFRVVNYVSLLAESMGLDLSDDYKRWKTATSEDEAVAALGERNLERVGERFAREQLAPELLRRPPRRDR